MNYGETLSFQECLELQEFLESGLDIFRLTNGKIEQIKEGCDEN